MTSQSLKLVLLFIVATILGGGIGWYVYTNQNPSDDITIANPASVYCEDQGGTLEIMNKEDGQLGYCHLPDGRVCEEWALFRDNICNTPETGTTQQ